MQTEGVKVLFIDIETSPAIAYSWGVPMWETSLLEILRQVQIIGFSAKWLGGEHITKVLPDYRGYRAGKVDDKAILKDIHSLLSEADIVVAHNGRAYDMKTINARMAAHGMRPPSPYRQVDTRNEARKHFRLPSNSLDELSNYFGFGKKLAHQGFSLWTGCLAGDKSAWETMRRYNKHDVVLLEKVYKKILPFMTLHPNVGMYFGKTVCPRCGSGHIQSRGFIFSNSVKYKRVQCQGCGGWGRMNIGTHRKNIVMSV